MSAGAVTRAGRLVGREREVRLLEALVAAAPACGGAAVIRGDAGIGKTVLLEHASAIAEARSLWVRGVESEAVLPFAAAADLLLPLREFFDHVPAIQRDALEFSLALRAGEPISPLAVCAAALGVLAAAAEAQPLLVLIDDLQWVDPASRQMLLFVARRLAAEHIVMLLTQRDRPGDSDRGTFDIPTLRVAGLTVEECRALVAAQQIQVSQPVLVKIVEQTGGNPLAVLETVAASTPDSLQCSGGRFTRPFLAPSLQRNWAAVIDDLPEATRTALLVLAASQSSAVSEIEPVLIALGGSFADVAPAERIGLVRARDQEVVLRSPLLRSVIVARASLATRLMAYRALAGNAEGHLRAWYLSASASGPDDVVAESLVAAALAARDRNDHQAAGRTWARAAELTVDPSERADRLLSAATDAHVAGEAALALGWCEDALALRVDPCFVADVEVVRGRATTWAGHPLQAIDDMVRAGNAVLPHDAQRAARLFAEAAMPAAMANRVHEMLEVARRSEELYSCCGRASLQSVTMTAVASVLSGQADDGCRRLGLGERLAVGADPVWDAPFVTMLGQGRVWLEDFDAARPVLGTVLDMARRAGAPWILAVTLGVRAELDWWTGHWASAYADATEALHWGEELQQVGATGFALAALGRIDASRGDVAACRQRMDRALRETVPFGVDCMLVYVPAVLGLAALGAGDLDTATQHLDRAWSVAEEGGLGATNVVPFGGDLVEAHIRAGHTDRAREALCWLEERAAANGLVFPTAAAARCRGLLADDPDLAARHFAEAGRLHQRSRMPFERGRTLLCEAETLRRLRRPAAARPLLREALAIFEGLGARPWAARGETELAATGARPAVRSTGGDVDLDVLTPQEFQIARTVAEGLNNAEAAAALFVSRKTVEAHLTRVYRKLEVRSRTELARRFAPIAANPDGAARAARRSRTRPL